MVLMMALWSSRAFYSNSKYAAHTHTPAAGGATPGGGGGGGGEFLFLSFVFGVVGGGGLSGVLFP